VSAERRENGDVVLIAMNGDPLLKLQNHRLRDEIAWLSAHGHHERAKVVAGWIGVDLEGDRPDA